MTDCSIYSDLKEKIHTNYLLDFREGNCKELVIVFSPNTRFSMYNIDFHASTLFISDRKLFYYLYNPGRQVSLLHKFIIEKDFKKVIMIGSSKGGTGALLWLSLLSKRANEHYSIKCFSFSPQVGLYPRSNVIDYPSYINMIELSETSADLKSCLSNYGNVVPFAAETGATTIVFYSGKYEIDSHEANLLNDTDITMVRLPLSFHGSITPYLVDKSQDRQLEKIVSKMFSNAERDKDLASTLPNNKESLMKLLNKIDVPFIADLVQM